VDKGCGRRKDSVVGGGCGSRGLGDLGMHVWVGQVHRFEWHGVLMLLILGVSDDWDGDSGSLDES